MSVSLIDSFLPLPFLALLMEFLILIRRGVCLSAQEMERGAGKSLPKYKKATGTWWIETIDIKPLYEARKYEQSQFDCVIGSYDCYAYRYIWPYIVVQPLMEKRNLNGSVQKY